MYRPLIVLALAGLLVACTTQGDGATDPPDGSAAASAGASGAALAGPSATCEEAFAPLVEAEVEALSDLGNLPNEVEPTIESCESVADWIAGAQQLVEDEIRPGGAALLPVGPSAALTRRSRAMLLLTRSRFSWMRSSNASNSASLHGLVR